MADPAMSSASVAQLPARHRALAAQVFTALESLGAPATSTVLDCGGGTGSLAVPLAELGATVTVVDISADALAILSRRAAEAGVADRVSPVQGDAEFLADCIGDATYDLVLVHGVLGDVDDPATALSSAARATRPGGLLSLVAANPVAGVLARVLTGELGAARSLLAEQLRSGAGLDESGLRSLCEAAGLSVREVHGVGVFSDLLAAVDGIVISAASEEIADLERMAADRAPYRQIAARIHLLCQAGPGGS